MHGEVVADEVRGDHRLAAPCFDGLAVGTGVGDGVDLGEQLLINEWAFLEGTWHKKFEISDLRFQIKKRLLPLVAGLDDEDRSGLLLVAGLLALRVAPWAEKVLATTTGLGLAFATTVRVVNGVHRHTTNSWTNALPAGAARFAGGFVHVIAVADLADGAEATIIEAADFTGRHFHERPAAIAVGEHGELSGGAGDFAAIAGDEFDVVNGGSERHGAEWHRVTGLRCDVGTGNNGGTDFQTERGEDVGFLAVRVLDEGDAASTVRIVLDADDGGWHILFAALEVDQTVVALVATADVTAGDAAGVVAATAALQGREKTLLRLALGNLVEGREILVARGWGDGLEIFQWHDSRNCEVLLLELLDRLDEIERLAFFQTNDGFFPVVGAAGISAALAAELTVIIGGADSHDGFSEELLDGLFDLQLVGLAIDFESDFVVRLLEKGGLLAEADVFNDLVNVFHDLGVGSGVQALRCARV